MQLKYPPPPGRNIESLITHYEVEKALASRLKHSTKEQRVVLYKTMYNELFASVPDHPRLTKRDDAKLTARSIKSKLNLVKRFLDSASVVVEFAPGDCRFAINLCNYARIVYGVDIADQIGTSVKLPDNFRLIIYNGYDLDLPDCSVDLVFSDQLIEHLHQEDTHLHFEAVRRLLKPAGVYVFRTPHKYSGPHDISRYFSDEPEGFHLKEWTYGEIEELLERTGYSDWYGWWQGGGLYLRMPRAYFMVMEKMAAVLKQEHKRWITRYILPEIVVVAAK